MKSLSVRLGVILIGLIVFGYAEAWEADWKYLGVVSSGTFWWYDAQGVTYLPNRIIQVWVKKIKAEEIMDMLKSGAKITVSELEQMTSERNYEKVLLEIDCVEKTINSHQKYDYDSKGILKSGESKLGAKKSIPMNSIAERLYKAVCK